MFLTDFAHRAVVLPVAVVAAVVVIASFGSVSGIR